MKPLIIVISALSMAMQGCYSSHLVTGEERKKLVADASEQIEINLSSGSTVRVDPFHYTEVSEPSDFIFGVGKELNKSGGEFRPFRGKISAPYIDASDTLKVFHSNNRIPRDITSLPDSTVVHFSSNDYVVVTPSQEGGLWCTGHKTASKLPFILLLGLPAIAFEPRGDVVTGRIPFSQIKSIEVRQFSTVKTVLYFAAVVAPIAALIIYSAAGGKMYGGY